LVGEFLKVIPVLWVALKAHGLAIHDLNGAKGVPISISWHGFVATDNMDRDHRDIRPGSDHSNSRLGFSKRAIKGALALREKNESPVSF